MFDVIHNHLCDTYKRTRFTPKEAEWPPNQPRLIVSVTLIHYKGKRTHKELLKMATIHKEGAPAIDDFTHEGPSSKKARLDYSRVTKNIADIFAADPTDVTETCTSSTKTPKRILIEGAPGIGKTVLTKEIAYQWAINEILTEIKIVFLLYLRDPQLQSIVTTKQLIEYMSMGCLDDEQITTLNKYLVKTKGQQLCIVMDGFDEYPSLLQENSFIVDIINGVILHEATVVITSRPTATVSLHDRVDRRIDILGLPKEEREKYISQIFSNSQEKKDELDKYLKQQPIINGLCFVPLHLAVLLYLFQQGSLPETLTEMNESFILHTIYRHLKKHRKAPSGPVNKLENVPKPVLDIVYKLSELAFNGLQENKLVFTLDEIKQTCPYIDETVGAINGFGLLQAVEHYPHKGAGTTKSFNFLHYTMQEFLAALHVSTLPSEQQSPLMKKTFWDGRYNFMWMMFVGIVGVNLDVFVNFISKGKVYARKSGKSGVRIADNIRNNKRKCLHVFQCYMEAKSSTEAPNIISGMFKNGKVILNGVKLLPHHISSLMTFMSNSLMQWKTLELKQCNITDVGMNTLQPFISEKLSTLEYVDLSHNDSSPLGLYCTIIRHCSNNNLALCGIQAGEMQKYVKEITANTNINSLTLCNISGDIKLIKTVLSSVTTLNEVNLPCREVTDSNDFHKAEELLFHTTVQYRCNDTVLVNDTNRIVKFNLLCNKSHDSLSTGNLKSLDASHRCIDDYGVTIITTLCDGLQTINLSSNRISDDRVIAISDYYKNNIHLLELNLSKNKITSEGAIQIAEAIKINPMLQNINISKNYTSVEGLLYVMEVVKSDCNLQVANITHNNVTKSESTSIKQYIKDLQHPIQIHASWNEINRNGDLVSKIYTSCAPDKIEDDVWSFEEYDPDHLVTCLSECLKEDDTLQELDLRYKRITSKEAKLIAEAIKVNKTLKALDISRNIISDDGAAAISDVLKSNNSLQVLNMSSNQITSKVAKRIAEAIKMNITLKILSIDNNTISDGGAVTISDSLKSNSSLQELNISCNEITSEGAKALAEAIKVNTNVHTLYLHQYDINDELSFNMTVLTPMYYNNTLMKLTLPHVVGDDERLVSSEVQKINKERTRQGFSTLTCYH